MDNLWIIAFVVGGFVVALLTLLLVRGRFGTPKEQANFEFHELLSSSEVPPNVTLKGVANCRGHDLPSQQILGTGVMWLTDDELGFVLRSPRRHFRIRRSTIQSARVDSRFARPGIEEVSDEHDFLIVGWDDLSGESTIVFQLPDPAPWAAELNPS